MKYMLMFVGNEEWYGRSSPEEMKAGYEAVMKWWGEQSEAGRIVGGEELQPSRAATTVRKKDGKLSVTDGPFIESKEALGGYAIVDVPDLDAAIAMAKSWPALETIEIRPLVSSRDESGVPPAEQR